MEFTVDLKKPIVFQVGHLGKAYQEWVHQPIMSKETPLFFNNALLELLTRTVWWAIPTIWLPVVSWFVALSLRKGQSLLQLSLLLLIGFFLWTLIEYCMHRFLFHIKTESYWANTAHYLFHGCHHKHPMDCMRLVFPPAALAVPCFMFWNLFRLLIPATKAPGVFAGSLLGYVIYDCIHYYVHHGKPSINGVKHLKRYHMNHHYRNQNMGFGVTLSLWDMIFGTLPPAFKPLYESK